LKRRRKESMPRRFYREPSTAREDCACHFAQPREFLREATGAVAAGTLLFRIRSALSQLPRARKAVVVTFGGGARDDETFAPMGRNNIPHMLTELAPRSTFFTQVINRGILGHYVATASLATGVYETFNISRSLAGSSDRIRIFPQRFEAPVDRRVGNRAEQRIQSHRRKRLSRNMVPDWGWRDPAQTPAGGSARERRRRKFQTICCATTMNLRPSAQWWVAHID